MGHQRPQRHEAQLGESVYFHSSPLSVHNPTCVCCASDAAQLALRLASSPPPPSSPRAFASGPAAPPGSAPGSAAHLAAAAAGRSAGPSAQQSALHRRLPRLGLRAPEALDAVGPRRGAGQRWPRLPHRLRARVGGDGAGIWVAPREASRAAPGVAGGEEATAGGRGRARGGGRGSAPRAATEHAQCPSWAGAAPREGVAVGGVGRGLNLRPGLPWTGRGVCVGGRGAVGRRGPVYLLLGRPRRLGEGEVKMVNLRLGNGIPEES